MNGRVFHGLTAVLVAALPAVVPSQVEATGCLEFGGYGDLNGDGNADAVVGDPAADVNGHAAAGAITVVYGQPTDPLPDHTEQLVQGDGVVPGEASPDNEFGSVIRVGYADSDGCADVFIGVPQQQVEGVERAGAVIVLYGSEDGLGRGRPALMWTEASPEILEAPEKNDQFGAEIALPAGKHEDQRPTIAIGAPGKSVDGLRRAGVVFTGQLDPDGALQAGSGRRFDQHLTGLQDEPERGDRFGAHLAVTDRGAAPPTLEVGVPKESVGTLRRAGVLDEITGLLPGETPSGQRLTQDDLDVDDPAETGDRFGAGVAYSYSPYTETSFLAVAAPYEDVVRKNDGRVYSIVVDYDGTSEVSAFDQSHALFEQRPERGDHFGTSILMLPYQVTFSQVFLVIGVPGEDLRGKNDVGLVHRVGVEFPWQTAISQSTPGIPGHLGEGDELGSVLGGFPATDAGAIAGGLMLGLPNDSEYPGGAVLITRFLLIGGDPEDPKNRPLVWQPDEGAFPPGGVQFGASVGGFTGMAIPE